VVNAGDDVSIPERTATLAGAWLASGRRTRLLHSAAERIDPQGAALGVRRPPAFMQGDPDTLEIIRRKGFVIGATAAWDKSLFTDFEPLGAQLSTEDTILPFRAALTGGIGYVDRALVKWRDGGISQEVAGFDARDKLYGFDMKARKWWAEIYAHLLADPALGRSPHRAEIAALCRRFGPSLQFTVDLAGATRGARLRMLPRALRLSVARRAAMPLKYWLRYCLDRPYIALSNRFRARAQATKAQRRGA
jgi:hypothetical protein